MAAGGAPPKEKLGAAFCSICGLNIDCSVVVAAGALAPNENDGFAGSAGFGAAPPNENDGGAVVVGAGAPNMPVFGASVFAPNENAGVSAFGAAPPKENFGGSAGVAAPGAGRFFAPPPNENEGASFFSSTGFGAAPPNEKDGAVVDAGADAPNENDGFAGSAGAEVVVVLAGAPNEKLCLFVVQSGLEQGHSEESHQTEVGILVLFAELGC